MWINDCGIRGILFAALAPVLCAGTWTEPVEVRHDVQRCVSYRARLDGSYLVVEATHEAGWHTNAMDNKRRVEEKLAGKQSLGVDRPTEILVAGGLDVVGSWFQTTPKDMSKPDLLWFTWGFDERALFVAKVRPSGRGPAQLTIRGQACSETTCKNIDVELALPVSGAQDSAGSSFNLKNLVQVRP